ncbi:hypothetical protein, partial [Vibrio harveyi]
YKFLKEVGYFDKEVKLDEGIKKILSFIFHHDATISQYSIYSIIRYGYYIDEYFKGTFEAWQGNNDLTTYLDMFQHWYLDDISADLLRRKIFKLFFIDCSIVHPNEILNFSERVATDIDRGSLNMNLDDFK